MDAHLISWMPFPICIQELAFSVTNSEYFVTLQILVNCFESVSHVINVGNKCNISLRVRICVCGLPKGRVVSSKC